MSRDESDSQRGEHTPEGSSNGTEVDPFDRGTLAKIGVGFLAAGLLLYLFGRVIGWNKIMETLAGANLWWVGVACVSSTVALVIWAGAWDAVLRLLDIDIPFRSLLVTYFAATFADYTTPFGRAGGNPFIAYVLSTDERASYEESLAGVVIADLLNLLPFFAFAAIGLVALLVRGSVPPRARLPIIALAGLAIAIPVLLSIGWNYRGSVQRLITRVVGPIAKRTDRISVESVHRRVGEFYDHLDHLKGHPRRLVETLAYSFGGWVFFALPLYLAGRSLGVPIDPFVVLFVVPASSMAGIVPTPGGLGGVEIAVAALLVPLAGLTFETAAAVALLYRVASYWYVLVVSSGTTFWELYTH